MNPGVRMRLSVAVGLVSGLLLADAPDKSYDQIVRDVRGEVGRILRNPKRPENPNLAAFREARFGLFLHWGLYAVPGGRWKGQKMDYIGEWLQSKYRIPSAEYALLARQFNPTNFNADAWAAAARDAGMEYVVLTSKHHEGFAMFKSEASGFNIVDATPFGRDVFRELADACRRRGLKVGFYYSQCLDWHERDAADEVRHRGGNFGMDWGNSWDWPDASKKDITRYLKAKVYPQLRELLTNYGEIFVIWFDCPFTMSKEQTVELREFVRSLQPNALVNSRIGQGLGDYGSLGDNQMVADRSSYPLETPMTLNDTWGFKFDDHNWKSAGRVACSLAQTVSCDANLLLNIGPTGDGVFPAPAADVLVRLGEWRRNRGFRIKGSRPSPFSQSFAWGWCTVAPDDTLQFVVRPGWTNDIVVAGIGSEIDFCSTAWKRQGDVVTMTPPEVWDGMPAVIRLRVSDISAIDTRLVPQCGRLDLRPRAAKLERGMTTGGETVVGAAGERFGGKVAALTERGTLRSWHHFGDALRWKVFFPEAAVWRAVLRTETSAHSRPWKDGRCVRLTVGGKQVEACLNKDRDVPHTVYDAADSKLGEIAIPAGEHVVEIQTVKATPDSNPIELVALVFDHPKGE